MFKQPAKTLFLDIRTSWELEREARIKASTAIPLSELRDRLKEIESKAMDRKIIIVCQTGSGRAVSAGIRLKKAGFSDVYVMKGGINTWQRADYPVTRPKRKIKQTYG